MLPATDDFDAVALTFEHSLVSISKWESNQSKAFFGIEDKTPEETRAYLGYMLLTENPPENFLDRLTPDLFNKAIDYINTSQTATTFVDQTHSRATEIITSELMYYWLVQFNIPFKPTEDWHISRLMALIRVAGIKQSKPKKRSRESIAQQYKDLNAQRREQMGTAG
jgi:hypothetical protein